MDQSLIYCTDCTAVLRCLPRSVSQRASNASLSSPSIEQGFPYIRRSLDKQVRCAPLFCIKNARCYSALSLSHAPPGAVRTKDLPYFYDHCSLPSSVFRPTSPTSTDPRLVSTLCSLTYLLHCPSCRSLSILNNNLIYHQQRLPPSSLFPVFVVQASGSDFLSPNHATYDAPLIRLFFQSQETRGRGQDEFPQGIFPSHLEEG